VKTEILGKLITYDPDKSFIGIRVAFLTPQIQKNLEELFVSNKLIKFTFNSIQSSRSKTYEQQKKFWVDVNKILRKMSVPVTSENSNILYDNIKRNIFPVKYVDFGEINRLPYVPEMKELTIEEMSGVINKLHDQYAYLKINWENVI